ncbi:hypothetical protein ACOSQ3_019564 [Xanthoceras sorbifolium]
MHRCGRRSSGFSRFWVGDSNRPGNAPLSDSLVPRSLGKNHLAEVIQPGRRAETEAPVCPPSTESYSEQCQKGVRDRVSNVQINLEKEQIPVVELILPGIGVEVAGSSSGQVGKFVEVNPAVKSLHVFNSPELLQGRKDQAFETNNILACTDVEGAPLIFQGSGILQYNRALIMQCMVVKKGGERDGLGLVWLLIIMFLFLFS